VKRQRNISIGWGSLLLAIVIIVIAYFLLPPWGQMVVIFLGMVLITEAVFRLVFEQSFFKWFWGEVKSLIKKS
jgi:uncharacterized membrane-anchored protein YitT (DUF2179 family)